MATSWCSKFRKLFCSGLILTTAVLIGYMLIVLEVKGNVPKIQLTYWGPGEARKDNLAIVPFTVNISNSDIDDFKMKLKGSKYFTPPLEGIGFQYGTNTNYLKKLIDYWKNEYDWKKREIVFNQFPQFTTEIGGLKIHFIHVKPDVTKIQGKEIVPLLLVHGWPSSPREFFDVIPLLTTPRTDSDVVFEVIAPSLPGFGFSQAASKVGMGPPQMAVIFDELMSRLGHSKFYYQGGDWGSLVGQAMSVLFPEKVLGYHSNFCLSRTPKAIVRFVLSYLLPSIFIQDKERPLFFGQFADIIIESGYFHIQATKPDTVGVGLVDSPVGLAAYVIEKFSTLANREHRKLEDGGLPSTYKNDDILDTIMVIWFTKSITTEMRLYSEFFVKETNSQQIISTRTDVPTACARFPHEVFYYPTYVLEGQFTKLKLVSDFEAGGHFIALEEPKLLADDLFKFLRILRTKPTKS